MPPPAPRCARLRRGRPAARWTGVASAQVRDDAAPSRGISTRSSRSPRSMPARSARGSFTSRSIACAAPAVPPCWRCSSGSACGSAASISRPTAASRASPSRFRRISAALGELVQQSGADIGMAVDPDVDRLALVDETGPPDRRGLHPGVRGARRARTCRKPRRQPGGGRQPLDVAGGGRCRARQRRRALRPGPGGRGQRGPGDRGRGCRDRRRGERRGDPAGTARRPRRSAGGGPHLAIPRRDRAAVSAAWSPRPRGT